MGTRKQINAASERKHVRIYSQKSPSGIQHVVTWYPQANERRRRAFLDKGDAEAEADRIEEEMELGASILTKRTREDIVNFNMICAQFPDATLTDIARGYAAFRGVNGTHSELIESAGKEFLATRHMGDYSSRHYYTMQSLISRFVERFGSVPLGNVTSKQIKSYLDQEIAGSGRTQLNHLIAIRTFFHWAQREKKLPWNEPTAADNVSRPKVDKTEHEIYTPEEMTRLLAAASFEGVLLFLVLGGFAGVRAAERERLTWAAWHEDGESRLVLAKDVTKTERARNVDVQPNLREWLSLFKGKPAERITPPRMHRFTGALSAAAQVEWKPNALRASFASYHVKMFGDARLTSLQDGHSVNELLTTYQNISGVTKAKAEQWFAITPGVVVEYVKTNRLAMPWWASLLKDAA